MRATHAMNSQPPDGAPARARQGSSVPVVYQLLGIVVPLVLLVQLGALLVLELRALSISNAQSLERVSRMADMRARVLGEPVWRLEYEKVHASLEDLTLDPRVIDATVFDDTGATVAYVMGAADQPVSDSVVRALEYSDGTLSSRVGTLVIGFASHPLSDQLTKMYGSGLLVCLVAALVLCIAMRFAAQTLIGRPLGTIMAEIRRARLEGSGRPLPISSNNEIGALASAINELQDAQARAKSQLEFKATHDELTGLPNRRLLQQRFAALRNGLARRVALHFLDLDDFKGINDTFGHEAGDRYLIHVATRLRAATTEREWVARLGGDEFVVLQDGVESEEEAKAFAASLLEAIAVPVSINGKQIVPRGSIGVAVRATDDPDVAKLLSLADIALYDVKEHRTGAVGVLTPELLRASLRRKELAAALPVAFEQGQLEPWFQGQFDIVTGDLVGLEALIRWRHPERGLISPMEFVPIIEQSGASPALARLVFERICQARVVLAREGLGDVPIAMNVSPHELTDFSFVHEMEEIALRHEVPLSGFEIEITEGLLINNVAHTREVIAHVRELGVRVALDDFGQGYSSLAYLRRFPLDRLKIDKAFSRDVPENEGDLAILEIIVALAGKLDLEVVVEGIEREEQAEALRQLGVRVGQGYLYHRPQPLDEFIAFMRRNHLGVEDLKVAS